MGSHLCSDSRVEETDKADSDNESRTHAALFLDDYFKNGKSFGSTKQVYDMYCKWAAKSFVTPLPRKEFEFVRK